MTQDLNKPIALLTVGEFLDLARAATTQPAQQPKEHVPGYVYGYEGIASIFKCSISTAARIKASGKIDKAIKQIGRKIIVDVDLALELAASKNGGRK